MTAACGETNSTGHVFEEFRIIERAQRSEPDAAFQAKPASCPRNQAAGR